MLYGNVPGISKPVSRIVQGTVMVSSERLEESFGLLDGVFETGCTAFDTAHIYGGGDNERTVGRWVRERGVRDSVVVIGKGAHPDGERNRVTPADIESDLNGSLDRFGFEKIDLYLLHRDDEDVPVDEIVDALSEHKNRGRIDAFGGSNWRHERIRAANEYAARKGLTSFSATSPQFSLAIPSKPVWAGCVTIGGDHEAQRWYSEADIPVFPWSSLGGGWFSGRFRRDNLNSFTDYFDRLCADCYGTEENFRRLDRVQQLAAEKAATPAQIALAWLLQQPMNLFPLVGSATLAEFSENLRAFEIELSNDAVSDF